VAHSTVWIRPGRAAASIGIAAQPYLLPIAARRSRASRADSVSG